MITNYLACTNAPINGAEEWKRYNAYIKFRTPNDATSKNTISVTFNPGHLREYPELWIGIGDKLYY
ncbi:MAG: hypothetical protein ACI4P7_03520 [Bacilli bacterium]